jgi:undecaprenyl-diphosphatase
MGRIFALGTLGSLLRCHSASGFSFPSGHSASAFALYATLAFLLSRQLTGWSRRALLATGLAVALAVGTTRIYLGAHYPTDVLAGWTTAALLAATAWALTSRRRPTPGRSAAPPMRS